MDASISPVGVRTVVTMRRYPTASKSSRRASDLAGRLTRKPRHRLPDRRPEGPVLGSQGSRPAGVDEHAVDVSFEPTADEPVQLMMVGPARSEGPVRHQATLCIHAAIVSRDSQQVDQVAVRVSNPARGVQSSHGIRTVGSCIPRRAVDQDRQPGLDPCAAGW